jgi:glyoxylase-like metal-dependent hydrolase (beta-lactamase superfamily II)
MATSSRTVTAFHCVTCGAQFTPSDAPPDNCPVCDDQRQYVPASGQAWVSDTDLAAAHRSEIRREGDYDGVGLDPPFAIGQRALLVPAGDRFVLWDCIPLVDDETAAEIERRGGLAAIAISHPHYYTGMVDLARRFDCPVYLHADDREWIMRPDDAIELWDGETRELSDGLTLIRCGGHFDGGTVLHDADNAALLSGDIVQVIPDLGWVGFMYSYPNLIPLPPETVLGIARKLEPYAFDAIYGAWWGRLVPRDGAAIVQRSAERYARAVRGELP